MIDLQTAVMIVLYLLGTAVIFAILFFLVQYIGGKITHPAAKMFVTGAEIVLVVLACLIAIGIILSVMTGVRVFRWGPGP